MWPITPPEYDAGETFDTCISRVRNPELRQRLRGVRQRIVVATAEYEMRAIARELDLIESEGAVDNVTAAELGDVYDLRMAKKGSPGRVIYDELKLLPDDDRCPFCDQRDVATLDHILPKAYFPALTVAPINLVAACSDCNKAKLDVIPMGPQEVVIHPYFDDVSEETWLRASVVHRAPAAVLFRPEPSNDLDIVLAERIRNQFSLLGLGRLYTSQAARETSDIRGNLQGHFDRGGVAAVREELRSQWLSRRENRLNSWQTATYEALANDNWYCSGGFALR